MTERKWEDLELDCLTNVLGRVGMECLLLDVPFVCKSWYKASLDPSCWKRLAFPRDIISDWTTDSPVWEMIWMPDGPLLDRFMEKYKIKECLLSAITEEAEASAIVTNLPNIKCLILTRVGINLKSLVIILEGCKYLEYLDVSSCLGFEPNEKVLELASHIKTFKCEGSKQEEDFEAAIEEFMDAIRENSDRNLI